MMRGAGMLMRLGLGAAVLICLLAAALGVRLVVQEQRKITSYSASTTGVVLEKRLERHERQWRHAPRHGSGTKSRFSFEPRVRYRYQVHEQRTDAIAAQTPARELIGESIFPGEFRAGGNLGYLAAKAPLDRFRVGQTTRVYYDPYNPTDACLIRRASLLRYLLVIVPVAVGGVIIAFFWPSSELVATEFRRRKALFITALWQIAGLSAVGHYVWLSGRDAGLGALPVFGVYLQVGLIPLLFALPDSSSAPWARRIKGIVGFSLVGTFIGLWSGLLVGWIALRFFSASASTFLRCWVFGMMITALLFALLGCGGEWEIRPARSAGRRRTTNAGASGE